LKGILIMEYIATLSEAFLDDPIAGPQAPAWPIRFYEHVRYIAELPMDGALWPIVISTIVFALIVLVSHLLGLDWHIMSGP
jgi:hypothetical protein